MKRQNKICLTFNKDLQKRKLLNVQLINITFQIRIHPLLKIRNIENSLYAKLTIRKTHNIETLINFV